MMKTHIMVDLETWGTTPGSDIRSIGAVVFDPITGALGDEFYVNVENPLGRWRNAEFCPELAKSDKDRCYPLTRDPSTVKWWGEQSPEAQRRLTTDVLDLQEGLLHFANWWHMQEGQLHPATFWAHGPHFDEAILAACYRAVGVDQPWYYRAPRDCRTAFDMAGDPCDILFDGVEHDALDDAKNQARRVTRAYQIIADQRSLLHEAGETFRFYERSHRAKLTAAAPESSPDELDQNIAILKKVERNADLASRIERALA